MIDVSRTQLLKGILLHKVTLAVGGLIVALLLLVGSTVNYIKPGYVGLSYNFVTGEIDLRNHPGWMLSGPTVLVTKLDIRPQRLCLTSSAHAGINCRLAQFDTNHYREFVAVEGWGWYWWSNRFSFNSGYTETYRGWRDVMRGYTFSAVRYPFIKVSE